MEDSVCVNYRLKDFKRRGDCDALESRRASILAEQDLKRECLLDQYRNLVEFLSVFEPLSCMKQSNFDRKRLMNILMLSQWLKYIPEDLETSWLFMFCPEGRRCVVQAIHGMTFAVAKSGYVLRAFRSNLPGAEPWSKYRSTTTILDCIFSESTNTFFILDAMQWGDLELVDTDTDFRQFWINEKLVEKTAQIKKKRLTFPYRFASLPTYFCTSDELRTQFAKFPYFPENTPKVDGILFYHRKTHYTPGSTPLVGWLKPFMISEVFGPSYSIAPEYYDDRPEGYTDHFEFMRLFDADLMKRTLARKARNNELEGEPSFESISVAKEFMECEEKSDADVLADLIRVELED